VPARSCGTTDDPLYRPFGTLPKLKSVERRLPAKKVANSCSGLGFCGVWVEIRRALLEQDARGSACREGKPIAVAFCITSRRLPSFTPPYDQP
jgi:hypothetical protein